MPYRLQSAIAQSLKHSYDCNLQEPIPDYIADLLVQIEKTMASDARSFESPQVLVNTLIR